jgi:3-dehydroquinate dehydratase
MAISEDAFNQIFQAMGLLGPQAESAARNLSMLSRSSDMASSALQAQSEEISRMRTEQERMTQGLRNARSTLGQFATNILDTADSVSGTGSVFTQISPIISTIGSLGKDVATIMPDFFTKAGIALGTFIAPGAGTAVGAAIGNLVDKIFKGTLGTLLPAATSIFNQYLKQGEKVIQAFNSLSTVGITFGGSITNMNKMIANTNMPLEMLARIAQQNAENLTLLGGGVSGALERVAKAARNDLGPQLVTLYGGFANLGDELAEYLAMEKRRGVTEDLLSTENIEGTKAYLYQLKEISALTGKSSKQLKAELEARGRNAAAQLAYSKMDRKQKDQYDKLMLNVPEGLKDSMQDVFLSMSRGMQPVSRSFIELQAMAPEAANALVRMFEATKLGPEEFNAVLTREGKNLATAGARYTEAYGDILVLQQAGRVSASVIQSLNTVLTSINSDSERLKTLGETSAKLAAATSTLAANATVFTQSIGAIYDAQASLARRLNETVLGNVETGGTKIREFAAVTVFATDAVKMLTANLDKLINSILGNSVVTEARNTLRGEQFQLQNLQNSREQLLRNMPQFSSGTELPAVGTVPTNITREMQERLRDADRRIREQEDAIKKAEERLREEQNKIEGNTSSTTGTTGTSISSTEEVSVKTAGATKLQIDPESIAAALKPMIDHQNILINDLKIALAYQGDGINRAVNRMA